MGEPFEEGILGTRGLSFVPFIGRDHCSLNIGMSIFEEDLGWYFNNSKDK